MLVRSESATEGMAHVVDDVYISSDRRVLDEVLAAKKPDSELRFYIGHSGWAVGQLDFELVRGNWHVVTADTDAIFSGETDSLWNRLIERLEPMGIQVDNRPPLPIPVQYMKLCLNGCHLTIKVWVSTYQQKGRRQLIIIRI